jgi:hypothetical protein
VNVNSVRLSPSGATGAAVAESVSFRDLCASGAAKIDRNGTEGSNPACSSGELAAEIWSLTRRWHSIVLARWCAHRRRPVKPKWFKRYRERNRPECWPELKIATLFAPRILGIPTCGLEGVALTALTKGRLSCRTKVVLTAAGASAGALLPHIGAARHRGGGVIHSERAARRASPPR